MTKSILSQSVETWNALVEFETRDLILRAYRKRRRRVPNAGRVRDIAASFVQARQYFQAAETAGMAVKPVLLFDGVQALSRGLILFLSDNTAASEIEPSHGLETQGWRETLAGGLENLGRLSILLTDGIFYELLRATNGAVYFRANSSNVNWAIDADLPPLGFTFTFDELARKLPDLSAAYMTWTENPFSMVILEGVMVDAASQQRVILRGDVEPRLLEVLFARTCCGEVVGLKRANSTTIVIPKGCKPFYAQLVEGKLAIGDVVVVPPFPSGDYLSPLALYYAASFILGMFARCFPAEWTSLTSISKGDAALPFVRRLLQLIEAVVPELALTFLRGPYPFEQSEEKSVEQ